MREKFRILSIDGGGLKGLIPLQVIKEIERITAQPIHKSFDLIAGSSTGGLLTCALLLAESGVEVGKRKYSLTDIEHIFLHKGKDIFPNYGLLRKLYSSARNLIRPQYNAEKYQAILEDFLQEHRISSCLKPLFISSYDLQSKRPLLFTTREASRLAELNARLVDVCRATSAAPTYFPSYSFTYNNAQVICVDGGLILNNPALAALIEVLGNNTYKYYNKLETEISLADIAVLSLGTGLTVSSYNANASKNWGQLQWIRKILGIVIGAPPLLVENQLETIYNSLGLRNNYLRINVEIDNKYAKMDDSSPETLSYYIHESQSKIIHNHTLQQRLRIFLRENGIKNL